MPVGVLGVLAGTLVVLEALGLGPAPNEYSFGGIDREGARFVLVCFDVAHRLAGGAIGVVLLASAVLLLASARRHFTRWLRAVAMVLVLIGSLAVFGTYGVMWGGQISRYLDTECPPPGKLH